MQFHLLQIRHALQGNRANQLIGHFVWEVEYPVIQAQVYPIFVSILLLAQ